MSELEEGEIAECEDCPRARPIKTRVVELFDYRVGYGPRGANDMFLERNGTVRCRRCADEDAFRSGKGASQN